MRRIRNMRESENQAGERNMGEKGSQAVSRKLQENESQEAGRKLQENESQAVSWKLQAKEGQEAGRKLQAKEGQDEGRKLQGKESQETGRKLQAKEGQDEGRKLQVKEGQDEGRKLQENESQAVNRKLQKSQGLIDGRWCLRMEDVTLWQRGGRLTADRLSFAAAPGEWILIVGEEPWELRMLAETAAGLRRPQEGRVVSVPRKAVLQEEFPYLESMRAVEYLMLPQLIRGSTREEAWANVRDLARESGLWEKRMEPVEFLTEYEKCLLMAASAFSIRPEILIAEDGMRALTEGERGQFGRILEQWAARFRTAVLAFGNSWRGNFPFQRELFLCGGRWSLVLSRERSEWMTVLASDSLSQI